MRNATLLSLVLFAGVGCARGGPTIGDGDRRSPRGSSDAGPSDAGPSDAGSSDPGSSDAGPADAGPADTGPADAGREDAGSEDEGCVEDGCPVGERCNAVSGRCEVPPDPCTGVTCAAGEVCVDGACVVDADGDGVAATDDCDDSDDTVYPGASERCNARDDDCDGERDEPGACSCDREERDGHVYLFCEDGETWHNAREACEDRGYHLVELETSAEDDWARGEAGATDWWLGLTDREVDGEWRWLDGEVQSDIPWGFDQPNGGTSQNCMVMRRSGGRVGDWHDRDCGDTYYYICETD